MVISDRRSGKDRRKDACVLCEYFQDENEREHVDMKATIIKHLDRALPIWVFKWIGGPIVAMILTFTAWTALKGLDTAERITKVETKQETVLVNLTRLMESFNVEPIEPKKNPKG